MGISPQVIGAQAHADEQLFDAVFEFRSRCDLVDDEGFGHDVEDGHARVERREGVLEDVLQFSPQVTHVFFAEAAQVELLAVVMEDDFAVGGFYQANDGPPGCGLTAARFADQTEGFAPVQGEVQAIHGFDMTDDFSPQALFDGKVGFESGNFEKGAIVFL